jgi:hypothetical protein
MKSRVSPFPHPLDQFRRDEPLPEKPCQDGVLKEVPKNSGVEEGRVGKGKGAKYPSPPFWITGSLRPCARWSSSSYPPF